MAVQSAGERFMVGVRGRVVWTAVAVVLVAAAWCAPAFGALPQQSGSVDLLARANVQFDGASAGEVAGSSVAAAGDVNGDGLADIIVGAPRADDNGRTDSGSAYVVFGRATPAPVDLFTLGSAGFRIDGAASGDQAGFAVAAAGDVDGDGLADVIVGAPYADPVVSSVTRTDAGAAYVVFGRAGSEDVSLGALGARGVRFDGAQSGAHTGWSVAGTGDINGNRRPDLVIGAPDSNSAYVAFGRAPTVLQQVTGTTPVVDLGALGTGGFPIVGAFQSYAGISVAGSGDVNGDGRPDVIVGAPYVGGIGSGPGSAYVVFGKADAGSANLAALGGAGFSIGGAAPNDLAGWSVAGAGDVNGDGLADVIVGAPAADPGSRADAGAAYVVFGRTATTSIALSGLLAQGYLLAGAAPGDDAGWSVAGAGDVNGDGRPDVLVGAPLASSRGANTGAAYVSFSSGGPTTVDLADLANAGFSIQGAAAGSYAGQRVASAGDTNGDSRPDVIVGAPYADANALADSGSTYLLYGFGPAAISYPAGIDAVVGSAVAPLAPTVARTGTSSFSIAPALPSGLSLDPQTGAISGTPTQARAAAAYTVTMNDLSGSAQTTVTVAVGGPATTPSGTPDVLAPSISAFGFTPSRFGLAARSTALSAKTVRGSTITFTLSEPASVRITLARVLGAGRTSGRQCVKPTARLKRRARCTRTRTVAALTRGGRAAGENRLPFTGRVDGRALPAGRYRAAITATDRAGNTGRPAAATFTITPR